MPLTTLPDVLRRSPYARLLGLEMLRATPGEVVVRMPFREEIIADDDESGRYVHGGATASLIDIFSADLPLISMIISPA